MPQVTFLPMNQVCEAQPGESILDVAIRNDVPLQHACGGFCACTTCQVIVRAGADHLAPIEEAEEDRLDAAEGVGPQSRLGCQAQVRGDVTVEIVNIDG
jgi:2Fe-2S ferredoxin